MNQQNIDYVLRSVEQRDIRFVRLWFVDILGRLKNFAISPEDLEVAFEEGIGFDGSAIEGFATPEEADMLAFPDASTFQILPWRPSHNGVARVFCDVCTPDRKPFAGDPRDRPAPHVPQGRESWLSAQRGRRAGVLLLPRRAHARAARQRGLLRSFGERCRPRPAPQHSPHAREDVRARGVHLPCRRPLAARHEPASRRGPEHVRRHHHGQTHH